MAILSDTVASSHMWLSRNENVASVAKEWDFPFYLSLSLNSHMWLMTTIWTSTVLEEATDNKQVEKNRPLKIMGEIR